MTHLLYDVRYAIRSLLRAPAFTCTVLLILTLGMGANTAIFSIVRSVLLKPLPFPEPDKLLLVAETHEENRRLKATPGTFLEWTRRNQVFQEMTGYISATGVMTAAGEAPEPEEVRVGLVLRNFFSVLGVKPFKGRAFQPEDPNDVIILGHDLWLRRFGGDEQILGKKVTVDDEVYRVIGVMPPGINFPERSRCWFPFTISEKSKQNFGSHYLWVIGRVKPGVTFAQARSNMAAVATQLAQDMPQYKIGWGVNPMTLQESLVGDVRPALRLFQAAVLAVLLIACANMASLQMTRLIGQRREIAVRAALGAGRLRLFSPMFWESLVLSLASAVLGLVLAAGILRFVKAYKADEIPRLADATLDNSVLGLTLLLALALGVILGLWSVFHYSRQDVTEELKEGSGKVLGAGRRAREALVATEMALALVLLVGAGLLGTSFVRLTSNDPGVKTAGVVTLTISLPSSRYAELPRQRLFFDQLLEQVRALPGVRTASLTNNLPVSGQADWENGFHLEGQAPRRTADDETLAFIRWVSPEYFKTLGIPLVRGRFFQESDTDASARVILIDEAFAHTYFSGQEPLGKRMRSLGLGDIYDDADRRPWEIAGIVGNVREPTLKDEPKPHYYITYRQAPFLPPMTLTVQTSANLAGVISGIQDRVRRLDPNLPASDVQTMEQRLGETLTAPRFNLLLTSIFAVVALILAASGIYGAISYSVGRRTQEIGIRMALGAQQWNVLTSILKQGLVVAGIGIAIGLVLVFNLNRLIQSLLYKTGSADAWTVLSLAALLLLVALTATYIPARRAARIDPNVALRYE